MKNDKAIVNHSAHIVKACLIVGETHTAETGTRKRNKVFPPFITTFSGPETLPPMASAFLMEESKRATFRALKTVYQRSGDKNIYRLMCECAEAMSDSKEEYENYVMDIKGSSAVVRAKEHTKQRDALTGKMIVCRPYTTFEFTEIGTELDNVQELNCNLDVFDLIDTAYLAYLELFRAGALIDFRDAKRNRGHVYKAIRRAIYAEKKAFDETELFSRYCIVTDKDGNETVYTGTHVDRYIRVDTDAALAAILETVQSVSARQAKCDKAVEAFKLVFIDGYTQTETAQIMNVNEKQVRRYIELVRRIADNAETRAAIAELLS